MTRVSLRTTSAPDGIRSGSSATRRCAGGPPSAGKMQQPRLLSVLGRTLRDQLRRKVVTEGRRRARAGGITAAPERPQPDARPPRRRGASARASSRTAIGHLAAEELRELREVERLGHEARGAAVRPGELSLAQVVRARQHDARAGVPFAGEPSELDAVRAGKHQVDEGEVERLGSETLESLRRTLGGLDVEPLHAQPDRHHARLVRLLVDHQHSRHAPLLHSAAEDFGMEPGSHWCDARSVPERRIQQRACRSIARRNDSIPADLCMGEKRTRFTCASRRSSMNTGGHRRSREASYAPPVPQAVGDGTAP